MLQRSPSLFKHKQSCLFHASAIHGLNRHVLPASQCCISLYKHTAVYRSKFPLPYQSFKTK